LWDLRAHPGVTKSDLARRKDRAVACWHGRRKDLEPAGAKEMAMSIGGVITTRDVLRYGGIIVREFGTAAWLRCCVAILLRKRTTFLNCVCEIRG